MKLIFQALYIARVEAGFYARFPMLWLATLAVALIPALYAIIYLSSVWDPSANTRALPVGLVNLDQGITYREQPFNIGHDVITKLQADHQFGYRVYADAEAARSDVRAGHLAFALVIPADFSANAVPGAHPGGGKLVVYTSAGNNFESANLARQFAGAINDEVNERLNEQRWAMVLTNAAGSQDQVVRLREGVLQLRDGSRELSNGAEKTAAGAKALTGGSNRLSEGVEQLTGGVKQLGQGLRSMDSRLPSSNELNRLRDGAEAVALGHSDLGKGLDELHAGATRLRLGIGEFNEEAKSSLFIPSRVSEGLEVLDGGVAQLQGGLTTSREAQRKLADGSQRVSAGVNNLTDGMRGVSAGLHTAITRLPEAPQLDQLATGAAEVATGSSAVLEATQRVKDGALHLALGMDLLAKSLPESVLGLEGNAQGLAHSVEPVVEVEAPVPNHGTGFAPNVIPGALWLGAGIAAFLIHIRVLPRQARGFHPLAQVLGKTCIPALIALLQAWLMLCTLLWVLQMKILHLGAFIGLLAVTALTFFAIVFALTRAFGDAGKALGMVLLALQLSSSGGMLPVELSGSLFETISPWLPMTWVVKGVKASMFGAFESDWQTPLTLVGLAGITALVLSCFIGRWRYVRSDSVRPAINF